MTSTTLPPPRGASSVSASRASGFRALTMRSSASSVAATVPPMPVVPPKPSSMRASPRSPSISSSVSPGQTASRLASAARDRPRTRCPPPLVLSAHHPRRHRLRPPQDPRRALGTRRGRPGRTLPPDPRDPRRRRLAGLRGLEFRRRSNPSLEAQPEVLGPHPLSRYRSLGAQLCRPQAVVEPAQGAAVDRRPRGRRLPDRGRGRPHRCRTILRGGDAGSENRRGHRPGCPPAAIRRRAARFDEPAIERLTTRATCAATALESDPHPKVWRSPKGWSEAILP